MNKPLDPTRSLEIGKAIKSRADNVFDNAYRAALLTPDCKYVQGFLVFGEKPYQPIEHSWIELDDCLVDPTFAYLKKDAQKLHYFPAHTLTVKQLIAAVEEAKEDYPEDDPLPVYGKMPYDYYGDVMLGGKDYKAAYEEALAFAKELNLREIHSRN